MTWAGVIDTAITSLIPVGSMIIANAMNTNGLALNRFRAQRCWRTPGNRNRARPRRRAGTTIASYTEASITPSLIPAIDNLRSLGIVWIPADDRHASLRRRPLYAAIYQFVVIAMILGLVGPHHRC